MKKSIKNIMCVIIFLAILIIINLNTINSNASTDTNDTDTTISTLDKVEEAYTTEQIEEADSTEQVEEKTSNKKIKTLTIRTNKTITSSTDTGNFNPNDVTEKSNISVRGMESMLEGKATQSLAYAFVNAERTYGVNAIILASIVGLESGHGTSERANNGSNNLTGHAVYNNNSRGSQFDSWDDCVYATAILLKNNYLSEGGTFFNGKSIWAINQKYSTTKEWGNRIINIANELYNNNKYLN